MQRRCTRQSFHTLFLACTSVGSLFMPFCGLLSRLDIKSSLTPAIAHNVQKLVEELEPFDHHSACFPNRRSLALHIYKGNEAFAQLQDTNKAPLVQKTPDMASALTWFLLAKATQKKQSFIHGMFVIEDPSDRLFSFLHSIPKVYSREISIMGKRIALSSHFQSGKNAHTPYGLDISKTDNDTFPLPHGHRHLLFGKLRNGHMYLKTESHGLGNFRSTLRHGLSFVRYRYRKLFRDSRPQDTLREEDVPKDLLLSWRAFIEKLNLPNSIARIFRQKARQLGIKYIHETTNKILNLIRGHSKFLQATSNGKALMQKLSKFDHLTRRFGNEVILTSEELSSSTCQIL